MRKAAQTGEPVQMAHAARNSYVAHQGGPEVFGERVCAEARRRNWEQAANDLPTVADGLRRETGYFREHQHRREYLEMREEECVVGWGVVKGGTHRTALSMGDVEGPPKPD